MINLEEETKQEFLKKASTFLVFDFEAAVRLKAWADASQLANVGLFDHLPVNCFTDQATRIAKNSRTREYMQHLETSS